MRLVGIRKAARSLGVHEDTMKRWELCGRVTPRRDHRGARYYTPRDLERLRRWREPKPAKHALSAEGEGRAAATARRQRGAGRRAGRRGRERCEGLCAGA